MNNMIANGVSTCNGGTYDNIEVKGVINIRNGIICDNFLQEGVCDCTGAVTVKNRASIKGTCKVRGSVDIERLHLYGTLNVNGDLSGETLDIDGAMDVSGEVNAEEIRFQMSHGSSAHSVFGHSIEINRGLSSRIVSLLRARKHELVCENMEGDIIKIEYCNIRKLSGVNIEIGPQCIIETLEYSGSYMADKTAVIKNIVKVGEVNEL